MASSSLTSFSLRLATVGPSLLLLTSRSSNRPLRSSSLSVPTAEPSMFAKTRSSVSLRFSSLPGLLADVGEQLAREDVEALLLDRLRRGRTRPPRR